MEQSQSYPSGFKLLMEHLHDAQRKLADYCAKRDEAELSLFFDPENGCDQSLRSITDAICEQINPKFGAK